MTSWRETTIKEINIRESAGIEPARFPDELFELYSVPSFDSKAPEIIRGGDIGSTKQIVEEGDVLICKINPRINRVWIVGNMTNYRKIASSEWIVVNTGGAIDSKYLMYEFSAPFFRTLLESEVSGVGGSLTRARPKLVVNYVFPLPGFPEQKRIVAKLDTLFAFLDQLRTRLEKIPGLLKQFRQAVLTQAVTGRLSANDKTWEKRNLGAIGEVTGGLTLNSKRNSLPIKMPYLRVANVYANELRLDEIKQIGVLEREIGRAQLKEGDLLIVEGNGSLDQIGRVAIWNGSVKNCLHQNHLIKVRFKEIVTAKYSLLYLLSPLGRIQIEELSSSTSGLNTLSISKVSSVEMLLPSLEEQREIVCLVESVFAVADRIEASYKTLQEKIDQLPQAILSKAFRGELVAQEMKEEVRKYKEQLGEMEMAAEP